MRDPGRIFLTGFMGCGKSTVAPPLAGILGLECLDVDREVERRMGRSVAGIFALEGERFFREVEREVLYETAAKRAIVVALGGGTIAGEGNFSFVKSAGLLVYLRVDFETLVDRLRAKDDRPLLAKSAGAARTDDMLRDAMARLLAEREPFYRRADIIVTPDPGDPERTAASIAESVANLRSRPVT